MPIELTMRVFSRFRTRRADALVELGVGLAGDLLASLVVDVAVRPEDRDVAAPLRRHLAGLAHLYFLMRIRVPHSPEVICTSSIRLLMIWRPQPRLRWPAKVFSVLGSSTVACVEPLALVQDLHLQPLPSLRLPPQPERQVQLLVAAVGVLERVDARLDERELDLVDLIARHGEVLAESGGLRGRDDLHLRRDRDRHRHLARALARRARAERFLPATWDALAGS